MDRKKIVEQIARTMKDVAPEATTILYGSEARGSAREDSDIDLLVLLPESGGAKALAKRKIEISDSLYEIELAWNVIISPLIMLKNMWEQRKTPFSCNVANEGIVL